MDFASIAPVSRHNHISVLEPIFNINSSSYGKNYSIIPCIITTVALGIMRIIEKNLYFLHSNEIVKKIPSINFYLGCFLQGVHDQFGRASLAQ